MDTCNDVAGTYKTVSPAEMMKTVRSPGQIQRTSAKLKKMKTFLIDSPSRDPVLAKAFRSVYKVNQMHSKFDRLRERRQRRSSRLESTHSHSRITDGNYNS